MGLLIKYCPYARNNLERERKWSTIHIGKTDVDCVYCINENIKKHAVEIVRLLLLQVTKKKKESTNVRVDTFLS